MLNKIHKSISNFFLNSKVQLSITFLILLNIVLIRWMPVKYIHIMSTIWMRIIFAILVAYLVCIHPFYGVALTTLLIVILNQNNNNISGFSIGKNINFDDVLNTAEGNYGNSNQKNINQIYHEPIFNPNTYHQSFKLINSPDNISKNSIEIKNKMNNIIDNTEDGELVIKEQPTKQLYNQHYNQTTNLQGLGGLHDIFIQPQHPANNTLTQNIYQKQNGTIPYLNLQNLHDAQNNQVGEIDIISSFPEIGNKLMLDAQGLEPHFPLGRDTHSKYNSTF